MRRASPPAPPPAERFAFLEGMRGTLALYVAVSHIGSMVDPSILTGAPSVAPEWIQTASAPFVHSHLAVAMFIVISGFSLQLGLLQRGGSGEVGSKREFFRRRAWRILPAYYACLIVSTVVAWGFTRTYGGVQPFQTYLPVNAQTFWSHVFLVQNALPEWQYKINGVLWTIAIEAQLYLLFPAFSMLQARRGRGVLLTAGAILGLSLLAFPQTVYLRLWFAFLFAAGMAAAHVAYRPPLRGRRPEAWVAAFGWLGLALGIAALRTTRNYALSDVPLGIALACLCTLGTVGGGGRLIRLLGARPLAFLGSFSYSLYLVHHPVEQVVYALRPLGVVEGGPTFAWLLFVGLPLMLLFAWTFSLAFERPFVRRRASRFPRARRTVPSSLPLPGRR